MGIVSAGLSGWTFVPTNLSGVSLQWALIPKACHAAHFAFAPEVTIWHYEAGINVDEVIARHPVDVLCFGGCARPPRAKSNLWSLPHQSPYLILSERGARDGVPQEWNHEGRTTRHHEIGGITDWTAMLHVFWKRAKGLAVSPVMREEYFRGAQSSIKDIVDQTVTGRSVQPPPPSTRGDIRRPSFYTLQDKSTQPRLVLPSVFSLTKWCERSLTPGEILAAMDVPGSLVRKWNSEMQKTVISHLTSPVKAATPMARCVRSFLVTRDQWARGTTKRLRKEDNHTCSSDTDSDGRTIPAEPRSAKRTKRDESSSPMTTSTLNTTTSRTTAWGELTRARMEGYSSRD